VPLENAGARARVRSSSCAIAAFFSIIGEIRDLETA